MNVLLVNLKKKLKEADYTKNGSRSEALICEIIDMLHDHENRIAALEHQIKEIKIQCERSLNAILTKRKEPDDFKPDGIE